MVSTERSWVAIRILLAALGSCRASPIEEKVYHAGDEEANEVTEIGAAEPGREGAGVEGLGHEGDGNDQPDRKRDGAVAVPGRGFAERHRLTVPEDVEVQQHDGQPGHDPV